MFIPSLLELYLEHYFYLQFMKNDKAYRDFLQTTGGQPDLEVPEHGEELLSWLRKWGCRQFAKASTDLSLCNIKKWHKDFSKNLPPYDMQLLDNNDERLMNEIATAYDNLSECIASKHKKGNKVINVRIGHTGASKILFALRPNSLPPWDGPIRESALKYIHEKKGGGKLKENGRSYILFMCYLQDILRDLEEKCSTRSIVLKNLPAEFGCDKKTTLLKILDEHLWVSVSLSDGVEQNEGLSLENCIRKWLD